MKQERENGNQMNRLKKKKCIYALSQYPWIPRLRISLSDGLSLLFSAEYQI